jgi:prepilin-type N-terminal cleavage/methylation domain-containing protein
VPDTRRPARGFTLIEVMIALFLIAVGVISVAPMFVYAKQQNEAEADDTAIGAIAMAHLERLHATDYYFLETGGDLEIDIPGYFDDSEPGYLAHWVIADDPGAVGLLKVITVRVVALRRHVGRPREVTVSTLKGV